MLLHVRTVCIVHLLYFANGLDNNNLDNNLNIIDFMCQFLFVIWSIALYIFH